MRNLIALVALSTTLALAAACSSPPPPGFPAADDDVAAVVSRDEARAVAEQALDAFNRGDYAGFSARWSADLKAGVGAEAFRGFRDKLVAEHGAFERIVDMRFTRGADANNVRFTFLCAFEKAELIFVLAFRQGGTEVVGVSLAPPGG